MNIVLINHYAGSPTYGMEFRPYYLAREWVSAGHKVTVIAASFSHLRSENPSMGLEYEIIDGIRYVWVPTSSYQGNGLGRIRNMISFILRTIRYLKKHMTKEHIDTVIASSTYPLDIYPAHIVQKQQDTCLIFEVHDLWPLSPIELGNIPVWHPYIMLMQKAENDAYRYCNAVVSILPCAKQHMIEHGLRPDKFFHIPNGIDVDDWSKRPESLPKEHIDLLTKLREEGFFIVGYAGAHGIANALGTLVEAASLCQKDKVAFVFIGQGPIKDELISKVDELGLKTVFFFPAVPKYAVPRFLELLDACYIGLQRQPLFRFGVSPNKLMDYMMSGRPILYAVEAGNDPVGEAHCGISVPAENPKAVAQAIRELMAFSDEERVKMGRRGREYVLNNHDYRIIAKRFLEVLDKQGLC